MRKLRTAIFAGAATLLVAGAAVAATQKSHVLDVSLPDGSVARIHYQGDVAPEVVVDRTPLTRIAFVDPFAAFDAAPFVAFDDASPFAGLERISAMMDRQAALMEARFGQMRRQMDEAASHARTVSANGAQVPAGVVQHSYVSTTTGNGTCTQTVEWRSDGKEAQPKVYKTSSGDCAQGEPMKPQAPLKTSAPKPAERDVPGTHRT